jgi:dolichyl-phosphate beta-glucosyltransferase
MALAFSLVIPAYNESARLPLYLRQVHPYLEKTFPENYEVLVVDDGSSDNLASVIGTWSGSWPELTLLALPENRGKGAAARRGMLAARGNLVLLADADGATPIEEEAKLREAISGGADIAVGSRSQCRRPAGRSLSGKLFAGLVSGLFRLPVRDSQCGFKMFRRTAAQYLFRLAREDGFLIDVEILALARRFHYSTSEVAVHWRDMPGSKVRWLRDGWRMASGLIRLRRRFLIHPQTVDRRQQAPCPPQTQAIKATENSGDPRPKSL